MAEAFDAIVLGAGAAGLMCAARAGQRGRRVLVLERAEKPGKKILISGGGRCNFTNIGAGPANYLSANPHFAKSALARYTQPLFVYHLHLYSRKDLQALNHNEYIPVNGYTLIHLKLD